MVRDRRNHVALVLAGGDGTRCREACDALYDDGRPKQFCCLYGEKTLIEETLDRALQFSAPSRTIVGVCQKHLRWQRLWASRGVHTIAQPRNRDTGPIALWGALMSLSLEPDATLAIFPSDHYVSDPARFSAHVEQAAAHVDSHPEAIVMIGAEPTHPETGYGWLVPMSSGSTAPEPRPARLVEKPDAQLAADLMVLGGYWNTSVIVCRAEILLRLMVVFEPEWWEMAGNNDFGSDYLNHAFNSLPGFSLSRDILQHASKHIQVLPLRNVYWTDLGRDNEAAMSERFTVRQESRPIVRTATSANRASPRISLRRRARPMARTVSSSGSTAPNKSPQ